MPKENKLIMKSKIKFKIYLSVAECKQHRWRWQHSHIFTLRVWHLVNTDHLFRPCLSTEHHDDADIKSTSSSALPESCGLRTRFYLSSATAWSIPLLLTAQKVLWAVIVPESAAVYPNPVTPSPMPVCVFPLKAILFFSFSNKANKKQVWKSLQVLNLYTLPCKF